ncbi:TolC family protein [Bacteroidota bacterium]
MKRKILIMLILPIITLGANAQGISNNMSLKEAVTYGMNGNTDIKKQNIAILQSRQQVQEVISYGLPQINGTATLSDNLILPEQLLPGELIGQPGTYIPVKVGTQYGIPLSLNANQLLYNQAYFVGIQQAKAFEVFSKVQLAKIEQDVIYNIAAAYLQAVIVREQSILIQANLDMVNQSLIVVQSQYDNQMARKIDLDQLKVTQANTQTDYDNSQVQFAFVLDQLKILMGYPLADTLILNEIIDDNDIFVSQNTTGNNPSLSLLQQQTTLKQLEIKTINSRYIPDLAAFGQYGYQSQFSKWNDMYWFDNAIVGMQLSIPIFDGLLKHHQVKQRKFELQSLQLDKELLEKSLNSEYNNAVNKYLQNQKTVLNQTENLALAEDVYTAVQTNYKNGLASLSDLINSDTGLKSAQSSFLAALFRKKISLLDILRANGSMTELLN